MLERHPQCLGSVGATGNLAGNQAASEADLVINIGTRLSDFTTASKSQFQNPGVRFIAVNVNPMDAHKHGAFPLTGDARAVLNDLADAVGDHSVSSEYANNIASWKADWERAHAEIVHPEDDEGALYQSEVIHILNEFGDENSTTIHASGGVPGDIHKLWNCKAAMDYHSEYGYSCMGYEIAGAMGVKMADPSREVYALVGDGSYMMLSQDVVTSIQEGLKITVILLDNHGFQCIRGLQTSCGGKDFGNEFRARESESDRLEGEFVEIDFCANAKSMGAVVYRAEDEASLIEALGKAKGNSNNDDLCTDSPGIEHPWLLMVGCSCLRFFKHSCSADSPPELSRGKKETAFLLLNNRDKFRQLNNPLGIHPINWSNDDFKDLGAERQSRSASSKCMKRDSRALRLGISIQKTPQTKRLDGTLSASADWRMAQHALAEHLIRMKSGDYWSTWISSKLWTPLSSFSPSAPTRSTATNRNRLFSKARRSGFQKINGNVSIRDSTSLAN